MHSPPGWGWGPDLRQVGPSKGLNVVKTKGTAPGGSEPGGLLPTGNHNLVKVVVIWPGEVRTPQRCATNLSLGPKLNAVKDPERCTLNKLGSAPAPSPYDAKDPGCGLTNKKKY
jgi:hypothetical protein